MPGKTLNSERLEKSIRDRLGIDGTDFIARMFDLAHNPYSRVKLSMITDLLVALEQQISNEEIRKSGIFASFFSRLGVDYFSTKYDDDSMHRAGTSNETNLGPKYTLHKTTTTDEKLANQQITNANDIINDLYKLSTIYEDTKTRVAEAHADIFVDVIDDADDIPEADKAIIKADLAKLKADVKAGKANPKGKHPAATMAVLGLAKLDDDEDSQPLTPRGALATLYPNHLHQINDACAKCAREQLAKLPAMQKADRDETTTNDTPTYLALGTDALRRTLVGGLLARDPRFSPDSPTLGAEQSQPNIHGLIQTILNSVLQATPDGTNRFAALIEAAMLEETARRKLEMQTLAAIQALNATSPEQGADYGVN